MDLVVDPRTPETQARFLRESTATLELMRHGWVPARTHPDHGAAAYLVLLFVPPGLLLMSDLTLLLPFVLFVTVVVLAFCAVPWSEGRMTDHARYERLRVLAGHYVLVDGLDADCARLWARTRAALAVARGSTALDAGGELALGHLEWQVARLLTRLSDLRAEHAQLVTPEIEEVARPLTSVLERSRAGVEARVACLERLAEAERTRAWLGRLSTAVPRYQELLDDALDYQGR
ncbi:hypothetical protein [Nonomuraea soli]|uniref:Uncharacterized protein n=1 Tax=Nonomuraea soli TaxID=1032476 RepID=A0A7W0CS80_9ACTN|nr:hypothetical protein [Nonomuraea soli]MBA2896210.1 hypothetical protein [Nonomuraea soli]